MVDLKLDYGIENGERYLREKILVKFAEGPEGLHGRDMLRFMYLQFQELNEFNVASVDVPPGMEAELVDLLQYFTGIEYATFVYLDQE